MEEGLQKIEAYTLSLDLIDRIHRMSLDLPKFELYEEGSQIRRSSKRVPASIVEGYTVRKYKALYLSYLYRGLASADETQVHLILHRTGSLKDAQLFKTLEAASALVAQKLFCFIQSVEAAHQTPKYLQEISLKPFERSGDPSSHVG